MILCLLVRNDGVFCNSRGFKLQPIGELPWIIQYLNFAAIDELVLLNVDRSEKDIEAFATHMRELAKFCFVPISAGGGVKSVRDFETLLNSGADKVVVNTHGYQQQDLISEAARTFGRQCVVVSIDAKRQGDGWVVAIENGGNTLGVSVAEWAQEVETRGAGELFLTSIDRDGAGTGYDIDLIRHVNDLVNIPVIASGGVGDFEHLVEGIEQADASAVSAANIFHYIGEGLTQAKGYIGKNRLDFPVWRFM